MPRCSSHSRNATRQRSGPDSGSGLCPPREPSATRTTELATRCPRNQPEPPRAPSTPKYERGASRTSLLRVRIRRGRKKVHSQPINCQMDGYFTEQEIGLVLASVLHPGGGTASGLTGAQHQNCDSGLVTLWTVALSAGQQAAASMKPGLRPRLRRVSRRSLWSELALSVIANQENGCRNRAKVEAHFDLPKRCPERQWPEFQNPAERSTT